MEGNSLNNGWIKYIAFICVTLLVKLLTLHHLMGIERLFWVTAKNFFIVMVLFGITAIFSKRNKVKAILVVNFIISIIFFIDAMYYSHFYTLIPVHSVYQIGQLGPVSDSIFALIKPLYFLFFLDSILVLMVLKKDTNIVDQTSKKQKRSLIIYVLVLTVMITGMNFGTAKITEGYFTPHNSGVINYHLYDIASFIDKVSLNVEQVQALMKSIEEEKEDKDFHGLAKDRNVIVIQAESIQNFVINATVNGEPITPVLNELIGNESIYFDRYYEQVGWGNTSDSEFISHNGFYPSKRIFSYKAYEDNEFVTLPLELKEEGYSTIAFHGNYANFWNRDIIYPSQGIDTYISLEDLEVDEVIGIGLSDGSLFRQSIDYLKELPQPFYSFFITVTSHHPFDLPEEYKELQFGEEYQDTVLERYLHTIRYMDTEIGNFIQELKDEGLYEDSIIVIYGDHKGLDMRDEEANELISDFIGREYMEAEMHRVPFIVHIPDGGVQEVVSTVGGQIDFFPTMANLLGVELGKNGTFGKDLLNIENGFVAMQSHVAKGSFIDDDKVFIMSNDGIFENSRAWDLHTGEEVDVSICREGFDRAVAEINLSEYILRNNLVPLVHEHGLENILELEIED